MKNTNVPEAMSPQQALIFIPDISGFTQFVTDTEINHARHIIEELLELLMDANRIGLEVSEIEGDAILFYRFGKAPTASEMMDQVREMFTKFHMHLRKYERHRVCNCGACCTAHTLAIKFVAHYGEITMNQIRQYKKLFGKEVIVAHRLLKNNIDSSEYSLFTNSLQEACTTWNEIDKAAWDRVQFHEEHYDSGKIEFCYVSLIPLLDQLPEFKMEDFSIKGMKSKMVETEFTIEAPIDMVFNVVADVPWRAKWLPGVLEEFTDINSELTQTGQTHRCLANGPIIVSHDYDISEQYITYTETDTKKSYCVVFTLKKTESNQTKMTVGMFMPANFIKEVMFKLLMKKKMTGIHNQAWSNLNNYCKSLLTEGKEHPYKIFIGQQQTIEAA